VSLTSLSWLDPANLDTRDVSGAAAVLEAARVVDAPQWLPVTTSSFTAGIVHGWEGERAIAAVLRDDSEQVAGVLQVSFPSRDNRHLSQLEICIDPAKRRRGFGTMLYDAGVARARAEGRTTIVTESWDAPASLAFATAVGLERASVEVERHQSVPELDWQRLDKEHAVAAEQCRDYELLFIAGATPPDLMDVVVELAAAINDAPLDDLDIEDEVFSPERIQAFDESQVHFRRRIYRIVARHRATGAAAGHTVIAIDQEFPWFAVQYDTSVVRAHRGHRLGLLLKIEMLRWLQKAEPQLRIINTWNAASNDHMIAVNELLGFQVVAHAIAWQQRV
jgi:RimJ/RimL family protein N-acetyltransferase